MTPQEFETAATGDGYAVVHRRLEANLDVDAHDHAWDTRGLVVAGIFAIDCDGDVRTYGAGEIFELGAGIQHSEQTGPEGAQLIVGRRKVG